MYAFLPLLFGECMYSIDWAIKKKFQIYKVDAGKLASISPTREAFDKFFNKLKGAHSFYIEEGGGDTFKLLALKHGHNVFTIPGKKIKDFRDEIQFEKTDDGDAVIIGTYAEEHPQEFYKYEEDDKLVMKISLLHREYEKVLEDTTRKKNQLFAFKNKLELLVSEKEVSKIIKKRKEAIKSIEKELGALRRQLTKLVHNHPLWVHVLKDVRGVATVTSAGIIGNVRRFSRFSNKYALRKFAGMISKKDNVEYNRHLKQALYNFIEGIIKKRTQPWRKMYDDVKVYYKNKHPGWSLGKVNNYTKKFVQTKFLDMLWKKGRGIENKL